jgi:predicted Zn-dependent peptidase
LARQLNYNKPNITTLDNKLKIICYSIPSATSVSVTATVGTGSRYETNSNAGISHFLEHILFKGTSNWPTAQILTGAIENTGGDINALTSKDYTSYCIKVPHPHWETALSVLTDMSMKPLLIPKEIEKEREIIHEELRMYTDHPSYFADFGIDEIMFPNHPLGKEIIGTHNSVDAITKEHLLEYMTTQYAPNNTVFTIVGKFEESRILEYMNNTTSNWEAQQKINFQPYTSSANKTSNHFFKEQGSDQTYMNLGMYSLSSESSKSAGLALLNIIFGEGMSSRLFIKAREELSLAYDISSNYIQHHDCGTWIISCGCDHSKFQLATDCILEELNNLTTTISETELAQAKKYAIGRLLLNMEDTERLATSIGHRAILTNDTFDFNDIMDEWNKITLQDITELASKLVNSGPKFLSASGTNLSSDQFGL